MTYQIFNRPRLVTADFWEVVSNDGAWRSTFKKIDFRSAMAEAARLRADGLVCDVRQIKEGR